MAEAYTRKIKNIVGNGTGKIVVYPTPGKRLHNLQFAMSYTGGTNTLAALMTAITEIRVKVGTNVRWRLNGTQLRDFVLLFGTTYDFNGLPNTECEVTLPFAPEWFLANVADSLAWNPAILGDAITVEIDCSTNLTITAWEKVSDDLKAPSSGIITLEVIKPKAASTSFYVDKEIDIRGRLILASIYPDDGGSNEITPVSQYVGPNDVFSHEDLTSDQNDEALERFSLTPSASGRSADVYDIVYVKDDMLSRALDLVAWGSTKLKVQAASAMSGTCSILLARLENK